MKRPLSVTLIAWLFMLAGFSGIIYHAKELLNVKEDPDILWIFALRFAAIVGGWFVLRGLNWARWLVLVWIIYHVYISFYHTIDQIIMHAVMALVVIGCLCNDKANAFFRGK